MRSDLFSVSERMYVPIEQIAQPSDISIFGTHFGESTYYADFAGIGRKFAPWRVLEIGVRFGYSGIAITSGALAGGAPPPVIYVGVDAQMFSGSTHDGEVQGALSNIVAEANFCKFRPGVDATFHSADTMRGLPSAVLSQQFDLINVDGDHSFEGAYGDLCRVWPLLASGGIIIVDDLGMADVERAVVRFKNEREEDLAGFQLYSNERGFAIFQRERLEIKVEDAPRPFREEQRGRKRR